MRKIVMDAFLIVVPRPTAVLRLPVFSRFVLNCLGFYVTFIRIFPNDIRLYNTPMFCDEIAGT